MLDLLLCPLRCADFCSALSLFHCSYSCVLTGKNTHLQYLTLDTYYDCSAGVLHIPTRKKVKDAAATSTSWQEHQQTYSGVNAAWNLDCDLPALQPMHRQPSFFIHQSSTSVDDTCLAMTQSSQNSDIITGSSRSCWSMPHSSDRRIQYSEPRQCFRGVHDDILLDFEVDTLIKVASELILGGGDHITIRNDTDVLTKRVPIVLSKLDQLLHDHYGVLGPIKPVAFRFHASISPFPNQLTPRNLILERLINQTVSRVIALHRTLSKQFVQNSLQRFAVFPLAFLFNNFLQVVEKWSQPIIEKHFKTSLMYLLFPPASVKTSVLFTSNPCLLTSDLESRPDFSYHTSIFLAEKGPGGDFTGGTAFYIQEKEWNAHQRWRSRYKIQNGLAIDGSRGRIIVATGGKENLHCSLPTKSGVSAVFQIWWDFNK